jgi:hypothetical protein
MNARPFSQPILDYFIERWIFNSSLLIVSIILCLIYYFWGRRAGKIVTVLFCSIPLLIGVFGTIQGRFEIESVIRAGGIVDDYEIYMHEQYAEAIVGLVGSMIFTTFAIVRKLKQGGLRAYGVSPK